MKYYKWVFKRDLENTKRPLNIDSETICDTWNPKNEDWDLRGGFNFSNQESILRWCSRGDTLCEVELPSDAEMINVTNMKTPGGILVANKIILRNPIPISDELTMELLKDANLPIDTFYETIAALATRGCINTALKIIEDKITLDNIDDAIEIYNSHIERWINNPTTNMEAVDKVLEVLKEIQSDTLINLYIDKKPLEIEFTKDNIINLTGQSGSGKSTFASMHYYSDDYLIIDTDEILSPNRFEKAEGINRKLGEYFRSKYKELPNLHDDFDLIYKEILDYLKTINKTIVIDCAQFHEVKDISILKGKMIILRTSINECYKRTIERFKKNKPNYTKEELNAFANRKKALFVWYKGTNEFIKRLTK